MDRLQEEVRSLQSQQKKCLKQQDKILQLLSGLEDALIGPEAVPSQAEGNREVSIVTVRASAMEYDKDNEKWIKSGSTEGLSKVQIYRHVRDNTFRVVGRKLQDNEVVINCAILKGLKYNKATETFHQWRDCRQVYGVNFTNKENAEEFGQAMTTTLDTLNKMKRPQPPPVTQHSEDRSTENGKLQFELYKMKVNQVEKELQDKSKQVNRLQRKVDEYQKHVFKKFDQESHHMYVELRNIQETCSNLASTVISVKEEFDKMWLKPPTKTKLLPDQCDLNKYMEKKLSKQEYFTWDGIQDPKPVYDTTGATMQTLARTLSQSDDSLERIGAAASRLSDTEAHAHSKMAGKDDIGIRENVSFSKTKIPEPPELPESSVAASGKVGSMYGSGTSSAVSELNQTGSENKNRNPVADTDGGSREMPGKTATPDVSLTKVPTPLTEREVQLFQPQWDAARSLLLSHNIPSTPDNIMKMLQAVFVGTPLARVNGLDTMIILDISGSMEGEAIQEAKTFVINFLAELERIAQTDELTENVGVVIVGHLTKILVNMTSDYDEIRKRIAGLEAGGKTPLRLGMVLGAHAIDQLGGRITTVAGHVICPRMIIVSDGKITSDWECSGPDVIEPDSSDLDVITMKSMILNMAGKIGNANYIIQTVVVGDADRNILRGISELSRARVYETRQFFLLSRFHKFQFLVSRIVPDALSTENLDNSAALRSKEVILMLIDPNLTQDERDEVLKLTCEILKRERENFACAIEGGHEQATLPAIGLRVRRGPEWNAGNDDEGGVGTITGHPSKQTLAVRWDCGTISRYRYGLEKNYDVLVVDEPRVLNSDTEFIAVGIQVKRGPDWHQENQDGGPGSVGVVFKVLNTGQCRVRWANGYKDLYNFGNEGQMDLEIVSPYENRSSSRLQHYQNSNSTNTNIASIEGLNIVQNADSFQNISQSSNIVTPQRLNIAQDANNFQNISQSSNITPQGLNIAQGHNNQNISPHTSPEGPNITASNGKSRAVKSPSVEDIANQEQTADEMERSHENQVVFWQWLDEDQQWQTYPSNMIGRIEKDFHRNPDGGSSLVNLTINGEQRKFRIHFSKMMKRYVDVNVDKEYKVRRLCAAGGNRP